MKPEPVVHTDRISNIEWEIGQIETSACLSIESGTAVDAAARNAFAAGFDWLSKFIMEPHPDLGRRGPVCPFARPSHSEGSMVFCVWDVGNLGFDLYIDILKAIPDLYQRLLQTKKGQARIFSVCIFLTGLDESQYSHYIDEAHSQVKPDFMDAGLMLGEFHPLSTAGGAHSDSFRPMRSSVPMFVIRSISHHDILFIDRAGSSPEKSIRELSNYLFTIGATLTDDEVARIENRIDALKEQVERQSRAEARTEARVGLRA
ncbi:DUF6875 domain-containing protein [Paraburkholderia sp.]|uniref:DUF6875 domain-containing protein n=1 Tax=Paraburkholderia sp. TaxID=1926495 RepID=UPI00238E59A2|nr:hypothetical protein [Paraburkholderia sp.]MDE1181004.1 hypothetical protein [Paraburkholderia sp.]